MFKFRRKYHAEHDYTEDMLPKNRKQLFFDVLKLNWRSFFFYGVIFLATAMPLHLVVFIEDTYIAELSKRILDLAAEDQLIAISDFRYVQMGFAAVKMICILIISMLISGFSRVIRQYAWNENVVFGTDFAIGFKENVKHHITLSFVGGLMYIFAFFGYNSAMISSNMVISAIYALPMILLILLALPICGYFVVISSIYKDKFGKNLILSIYIYAKQPFKTWLVLIFCLILFSIQFIPNFICSVLGRIIGSMAIPVILLAWYLFVLSQLDEMVNKKYYPDLVNRGLFKS